MSEAQKRKLKGQRTPSRRSRYAEERGAGEGDTTSKGDTTLDCTLIPASGESGVYRQIVYSPGDDIMVHRKRPEHPAGPVKSATTVAGKTSRIIPLLAFIHLTDLHVTDAQSPARAEFLDRLGDIDSPLFKVLGNVGTYRPQEILTAQVLEAMVRKIRKIAYGPMTSCLVSFVMATGDVIDNSQYNELRWYLDILKGGVTVTPDSGDYSRYEGVGSDEFYDERYWQPASIHPDIPHERYGFPDITELLEACRRPFVSEGLAIPCYTVAGNHDFMLAGTVPHNDTLCKQAVGSRKYTGWAEGVDIGGVLADHSVAPPDISSALAGGHWQEVTSDPDRYLIGQVEWQSVSSLSNVSSYAPTLPPAVVPAPLSSPASVSPSASLSPPVSPPALMLPTVSPPTPAMPLAPSLSRVSPTSRISPFFLSETCSYYAFDAGIVRFLVLDTVNRSGGWQGSLDHEQLSWLHDELAAGHSHMLDSTGNWTASGNEDRLFILCSHHPFDTLVNGYTSGQRYTEETGRRDALSAAKGRVLLDDLGALLARFPNIVLWLNGHTHRHRIKLLQLPGADHGIWEITTASLIDWPQQGRVIELAINPKRGQLIIFSTVFDHAGAVNPKIGNLHDPLVLAGLSREFSANSWHRDMDTLDLPGRGTLSDRNAVLHIPLPFPISLE